MVFAFIGTTEIIIVLVIALIVFGPQKLPEIGRQVGSAMRELQRVRNDVQRALDIDEYTRLDLPSYDPPSYGSTYTYEPETSSSTDYSSTYETTHYDSPVNREFVPPPGPPARQTALATTETATPAVTPAESTATVSPQQPSEQSL
jgi:sec-independent protein translocase protein TatA